jgi:hypothetical protein
MGLGLCFSDRILCDLFLHVAGGALLDGTLGAFPGIATQPSHSRASVPHVVHVKTRFTFLRSPMLW